MADATAGMVPPAVLPAPFLGAWAAVQSLLGGWPSMAGITAAAAAGIVVGFSSPDLIEDYIGTDTGYALEDFLPDIAELAAEE
jgi:hypothetical protein